MGSKLTLLRKLTEVSGHVLAERLCRPIATRAADVPRDATTLSDEWLTAVLCANHPGSLVIGHTAHHVSSGTSTRSSLHIRYNGAGLAAGLPERVFVKASKTLAQRLIIGGSGALAGETRFFMNLLPQTKIEAPTGYWGGYDDASWRSVIMLEDIVDSKGARFIEPTELLSRQQVADVIVQMATYHGNFWGSRDLDTMKSPQEFLSNLEAFANMRGRSAVGQQRAIDVIPEELRGQADRIWRSTLRSLEIATHEMPGTLLHADPHVGQTYVTSDGRMGLTDWQTCLRGGWAYDFAYFLITACSPEDRREWEESLLRLYLDRLRQEGGQAVGFDEAWLRYRQMPFYPMTAWCFTIGRAFYQPRMQPDDTCRTLIHRLATAINELDSFEAVGV